MISAIADDETVPRRVSVLGSTGSVGRQTIDLIAAHPDRFVVTAISAAGTDIGRLAAQAAHVGAPVVGVADASKAVELHERLKGLFPRYSQLPLIVTGGGAASEIASLDTDIVLNAIDGARGMGPTLAAIDAGHVVALANKESLIAGGTLLASRAAPGQILPVDSEHSAIAQCLRGGTADEVERLILTASGGPFRGFSRSELGRVTANQALAHPTWQMGPVITTNSATLMNKGLELIEAHLLFAIEYARIDVVVHPQSYVHSMVEFNDGAVLAQVSPPDMRLPISWALGWPRRVGGAVSPVDWTQSHQWQFEPVDERVFPAVSLARVAGQAGGCAPAVLNASNEYLVSAFHKGWIDLPAVIDKVGETVHTWLHQHHVDGPPANFEQVDEAQAWARRFAAGKV